MEELSEEEMKREGGACLGDVRMKGGYIHIATKQKKGWYVIDKEWSGYWLVEGWTIGDRGGGSTGNLVADKVRATNRGLEVYSINGGGYCTVTVKYRNRLFPNNGSARKSYRIQFLRNC